MRGGRLVGALVVLVGGCLEAPAARDEDVDAAAEPASCSDGDRRTLEEDTGHCYLGFDDEKPWTDARASCEAIGAHLATVADPNENELVAQVAASAMGSWLGANDIDTEGTWRWIDDTVFDSVGWRAGEPSDAWETNFQEDCLEFDPSADAWSDVVCDDVPRPWVCEREPPGARAIRGR